MGIEVSAKDKKNILEMLYCAQSCVLYPLSPLMDLRERELTPKYKKALTRIFRILDTDNSGTLNDAELSSIQHRVFENELTQDDLKSLKEIVKDEAKEHYNPRHITLEGFFAIKKYFLGLMKIKNSWLILKHFGYDKKLDLFDELFQDTLVIQNHSTVELKEKTILFLKKIFNQFSEGSGYLTPKSIEKIFEPLDSKSWSKDS